jgi:hypothetical protein
VTAAADTATAKSAGGKGGKTGRKGARTSGVWMSMKLETLPHLWYKIRNVIRCRL